MIMIIIGLLDSTLEEGLDIKAEGTDGGSMNRTHTRNCTHMSTHTRTHTHTNTYMLSHGGHTYLSLCYTVPFISFLLFHNPVHAIAREYTAHIRVNRAIGLTHSCFPYKLLVKLKRRHR